MSLFEKIALSWQGREYSIPPDGVMQCIAKIEDVITLAQLHQAVVSQSMPLGKLSMAYGALLRHAGARVTDEDVYAGMFKGGDMVKRAIEAIHTLQMLMIPPEHLKATAGKAAAGAPPRVRSSKKLSS